MDRLKSLQSAKRDLEDVRKEFCIRSIQKSGCTSFNTTLEGYLCRGINELWTLVCDVTDTKLRNDIRDEARRMKDEANEILDE